jgi:hypothetical protein
MNQKFFNQVIFIADSKPSGRDFKGLSKYNFDNKKN